VQGEDTVDDVDHGDILRGVPRITAFLRWLFAEPDLSEGKVYAWLAKGQLPHTDLGAVKIASKQLLRARFRETAPLTRPVPDRIDRHVQSVPRGRPRLRKAG
jgi:hypothetical protein